MKLFNIQENRIKCGRCNTEFDINKNKGGCPLCGFSKKVLFEKEVEFIPIKHYPKKEEITVSIDSKKEKMVKTIIDREYIGIPPKIELKVGKVFTDDETKTWGSWLMFNDFFAPKFLARVLAWKTHKEKSSILLSDLMKDAINLIQIYNLSSLKGFPNLRKDSKGHRLVHHFLRTFTNMGFFKVESIDINARDVWKEDWDKINISLTKEGLEFAQLRNPIFEDNKEEQILSDEEIKWLISYLKQIDRKGYREYSVLKEVYDFLKKGRNGNKDLWIWFEENEKFRDYILKRSKKARNDPKIFDKQLHNYARTFASAKVSLLRELGVVRNKRNDYSILEDLE